MLPGLAATIVFIPKASAAVATPRRARQSHDPERHVGQLAQRPGQRTEVVGTPASPGARKRGVVTEIVGQHQQRADHVLDHGLGAVRPDVADDHARRLRAVQVDVVRSGRRQANEAEVRVRPSATRP